MTQTAAFKFTNTAAFCVQKEGRYKNPPSKYI